MDFHLFERKGIKISSGVQAAPLNEFQQGLGLKPFTQNRRVKRNFGGFEHLLEGLERFHPC